MLTDLESEIMTKGGNQVEQRKLFDAFLGSSGIWQPQPCKEHSNSIISSSKLQVDDKFADENANSNIATKHVEQNIVKKSFSQVTSLNFDAPPFYSSNFSNDSSGDAQFPERLERTRSLTVTTSEQMMLHIEPENKMHKQSISTQKRDEIWAGFLPDSKDFEAAIIAAVLDEKRRDYTEIIPKRKVGKRLRVFQDIITCV